MITLTRKYWYIIMLMLFIIPSVYALNYQTNMYATDTGLQIFYSGQEYYKFGQNFNINIMVINMTNNVLNSSFVNCSLNIYNKTGNIILNTSLITSSGNDLTRTITSSNINSIGYYNFNIFCNASSSYGVYSSYFRMTNTGDDDSQNTNAFLPLMIMVFGVIIILMIIAERIEFGYFVDSSGKSIPFFKYLVWLVSGWILLIPIYTAVRIIEIYNLFDSNIYNIIYSSIMYVMLFMTAIWLVGFLYKVLEIMGLFTKVE